MKSCVFAWFIPFCDGCRPEAGRYQLVMNSPREGTDCYDNVMSWDGMPIGEPDYDTI